MPIRATIFGANDWLIILAVVMLLFGATKLPQLARALGQSARELKKGLREGEEEAEAERAKPVIHEVEPDALPGATTAGRPKSRTRSRENH